MESFMAGSITGAMSCCIFQPLDLIKTRIQAPSVVQTSSMTTMATSSNVVDTTAKKIMSSTFKKSNGIPQTVYKVIQEESVFGLWRGLMPSLYRTVPGVGMYFCTLHGMKSFLGEEPKFYENLLLGATARTFVGTTLLPVTVIKARYESGRFNYRNVSHGLSTVWKTEGLRGLFSGCTATIARDAPFSGMYLMFYSQEKKMAAQWLGKENLGAKTHFACGISAGLLASLFTHPADVVKTQLQLYPNRYKTTQHCITMIYGENGLNGFFRGIAPRCLRRTLISAFSWTVFEEIMKQIKANVASTD